MNSLLSVENLSVEFKSGGRTAYAVNDVSLRLEAGENLGIVGESGSGKSTLAHAVMRLLPDSAVVTGGRILFDGRDLTAMPERELRALCGQELSMIFQDPMQCLDPSFSVGSQLTETLRAHEKITRAEARTRAAKMLRAVGLEDAEKVMRQYPFALSGGMQQRVMIAMALLTGPRLLIADEPTTALDVTVQDQSLHLLKELTRQTGLSVLFITHSFGVVAEVCDRVAVLYGGRVAEYGTVRQLFANAAHPYTQGLLAAVPSMESDREQPLSAIDGTPVSVFAQAEGCPFAARCPRAEERCRRERPALHEVEPDHFAACHAAKAPALAEQTGEDHG